MLDSYCVALVSATSRTQAGARHKRWYVNIRGSLPPPREYAAQCLGRGPLETFVEDAGAYIHYIRCWQVVGGGEGDYLLI